jgi:hypothetical protein
MLRSFGGSVCPALDLCGASRSDELRLLRGLDLSGNFSTPSRPGGDAIEGASSDSIRKRAADKVTVYRTRLSTQTLFFNSRESK